MATPTKATSVAHPESKTQAERTAASDRAMIDAAVQLILEHGIEGTTLSAIGEHAGYSRGLATYRFGSKAGLFEEVSNTIHRRWVGYLNKAVGAQTGADALKAAADAYYRFVTDAPEDIRVLHILYYGGAQPNGELRGFAKQAISRQIADAERWINEGIADGSVRDDISPRTAATQYVAHIAGITYIWLLNPQRLDFSDIHREFIRTLTEQLAP
ncbi:MAG: helix-turn-helix domain-containing protein [Pseudomonadota bacterium]